jgi:hypothetical protein
MLLIAAVIVFCVLLFLIAFLVPRHSHGPQRAGQETMQLGSRGASKAPGKLGKWFAKPFRSSSKAMGKSASAGRAARGKTPV